MPASSPHSLRFIHVDLKQVHLVLGDRTVLRGVNWTIRPGERWVLLGLNGAGKTQLLKMIAGDVWPTPSARSSRCYHYHSDTHRDPYLVKDEIAYVGAERQDRYEHYRWNHSVEAIVGTGLYRTDIPLDPLTERDRDRVARRLRQLRIEALAQRRFLTLSYGERRLVLLARALAWRPKLLLLDELFNGLDSEHRKRVQQCLKGLSRSSLPWVLSTHRSADVPPEATHLCQLQAGRVVARRKLRRAPARRRSSTQSTVTRAVTRAVAKPRRVAERSRPAIVKLSGATVWRDGAAVLRNVSLTIRRGDCWVVHGGNGSGKSSLLQLLYGDLGAAQGGSIWREGIQSGVSLSVFKRRVGLIAPELQALHPRYLQVAEVVWSGQHASIGLNEAMPTVQQPRIRRALREVGAVNLYPRLVRTLSYGQLRRVLFARALMHAPDLLLLDEPYAGIDAVTRRSLQARVERASAAGVTIVMATHHRGEWPAGVDHEIELRQSQVVYCGPVRQ